MNCDAAVEAVSALLDGALAPGERAVLEGHLGGCAGCRGRRRELEEVRALLRSLDDAPPPAAAREVAGRVLAALAGEAPPEPPPAAKPRSIVPLAIAGAALGTLLAIPLAIRLVGAAAPKRSTAQVAATPAAAPVAPAAKPEPAPGVPEPPAPARDLPPASPDPLLGPVTPPSDLPPPVEPPSLLRKPPLEIPDRVPRDGSRMRESCRLEAVVSDAATLEALRRLFEGYPGKVTPGEARETAQGTAVSFAWEGEVSDRTAAFEKALLGFQQEHAARLPEWSVRSALRPVGSGGR